LTEVRKAPSQRRRDRIRERWRDNDQASRRLADQIDKARVRSDGEGSFSIYHAWVLATVYQLGPR
jgi:hypothetical protein